MLEIAEREAVESSVACCHISHRCLHGWALCQRSGSGSVRKACQTVGRLVFASSDSDLAYHQQGMLGTEGAGCPTLVGVSSETAASRF